MICSYWANVLTVTLPIFFRQGISNINRALRSNVQIQQTPRSYYSLCEAGITWKQSSIALPPRVPRREEFL